MTGAKVPDMERSAVDAGGPRGSRARALGAMAGVVALLLIFWASSGGPEADSADMAGRAVQRIEAAGASEGDSSSLDLAAVVPDPEQLAEGRADVAEAEPSEQLATLEVELDLAENLTALTLTAATAPVAKEGFTPPAGPGMTVAVVGGAWTGRIWMEQVDEKRFLLRNLRPGVELLFREHFGFVEPNLPPVLGPGPGLEYDAGPVLASQLVILQPGERQLLRIGRLGAPTVHLEAQDARGNPMPDVTLHLHRLGGEEDRFGRQHIDLISQELGEDGQLSMRLPLGLYDITMRSEGGGMARIRSASVRGETTFALVLGEVPDTVVVLIEESSGAALSGWADELSVWTTGEVPCTEREDEPGVYVYEGLTDSGLTLDLPVHGATPVPLVAGARQEVVVPDRGHARLRIELDLPLAYPGGPKMSCWAQVELVHIPTASIDKRTFSLVVGEPLEETIGPLRAGAWEAKLVYPAELSPEADSIRRELTHEFEVRHGKRVTVPFHPDR